MRGVVPDKNSFLYDLVFDPAHFVMERKMMLGVKQRAERGRGQRAKSSACGAMLQEMEASDNAEVREVGRAAIDISPPGSITVHVDPSARLEAAVAADAIWRVLQQVQSEVKLVLTPLRLIVLSAKLDEVVSRWQRDLGLPEGGVSKQPEAVPAGKTISWGKDKESARSIIILADYVAAGVVANISVARASVAHELGHVHDEYQRGLVFGFPEASMPPTTTDWPKLCAYVAEMIWSEYAAESVAACYMTSEDLQQLMLNAPVHLAGIHERLSAAIDGYKAGQRDLSSLWGGAITDVSDVLANLGRAIAHLPPVEEDTQVLTCLTTISNEAACWKPIIERVMQELQALATNSYSGWGPAPWRGLASTVALAFEAVGLLPTYRDGKLSLKVR
jgi:hypothetical protein